VAGLWFAPERAWRDVFMGAFFITCLGLAGLIFIAIQYASGAVWSIALRRVAEAMMAALPAGCLGVLLVLSLKPQIYPWYRHIDVAPDGWTWFKLAWLSYPFFLARSVCYVLVWLAFAWAIRRNSRRQDEEGDGKKSKANTRLSAAFLVAFGVTFWLASSDWVMTFEPRWASTMFGIYNFSGMFTAGVAVLALLTITLRRAGPLRGSITDYHLLDLGRLLLAFATFWGYIWFSQYMLIWYTNMTEETAYMVLRTNGGWEKIFIANFLLNWALPFLVLLPRANKKNPRTLAAAAVLVLMGRITDIYLMMIPPFAAAGPRPELWDFAALALVAGGFVILVIRAFFAAAPIPVGDPLLQESLHVHA